MMCLEDTWFVDKAVSTNQLKHWRKGLLATAQHKPGKPRLLLSYSDGRTKAFGLSGMLPRVADLLISEAPVKLNRQFELQQAPCRGYLRLTAAHRAQWPIWCWRTRK